MWRGAWVFLFGVLSCGDDAAGARDAGLVDAGESDAGVAMDAGDLDAGAVEDAGAVDAGAVDAGAESDAGAPDAGPADAGPVAPDAAEPDAAVPECPSGTTCGDHCCVLVPSNASRFGRLERTGLRAAPASGTVFDTGDGCVEDSPLGRCVDGGSTVPGMCVCRADQLVISDLTITGYKGLVLLAWDSVRVEGLLTVRPGAGVSHAFPPGNRGGSFGTRGGNGGADPYGTPELVPIAGGTDGGNNRESGGGALQISAGGRVEVTGAILVAGGAGITSCSIARGGGSGGAILVEAPTVELAGDLSANGGGGAGAPTEVWFDLGITCSEFGDDGAPGALGATAAPGGLGATETRCGMSIAGGDGGDGASGGGDGGDGGPETDWVMCDGRSYRGLQGGGGGGAGRIRINSGAGACACSGGVSPPPSQGTVVLE